VIPVVLGVTVLVFVTLHFLPGDPATIMMAGTPTSALAMQHIRAEFALGKPAPQQYLDFLASLLRGDLGWSLRLDRPVRDLILENLGSTVELALASLVMAVCLGFALGIAAALKPDSLFDSLSTLLSLLGISVPEFWLGLVLILVFSISLGWIPIVTQGGVVGLILPAVTLGLSATALIARLTRSSMLETLAQDYVRTARAKGLNRRAVIVRHALRNGLIPVATVVGLQFGRLMAGAVVVEIVFSRQGIGQLVVSAILDKDMPLVQGVVLFVALMYVVSNLAVDVFYTMIDPRIRFA